MLTLTLPGLERARRLGERPLSNQRPVTQDHATHNVSQAYAEPTSRFISRPMVSASLPLERTPTRLSNVPVNNHRNNVVHDAQQSGEASTFHGGGLSTDPIDLEDDRLHLDSSDQDVTPQGHSIISASQAPDAHQPRAAAPLDTDQERRTNIHRQRGNPPTIPFYDVPQATGIPQRYSSRELRPLPTFNPIQMQGNVCRERQPASSDHVLHKAPQSMQASHVYVRSQPKTRPQPRPEKAQQISNGRQGHSQPCESDMDEVMRPRQQPGAGFTMRNVPQVHGLPTLQVDSRPTASPTSNAEQTQLILHGQHQGPQQRANELDEEARRRLAMQVYGRQRAMLEHTAREREILRRQYIEWQTVPDDRDRSASAHEAHTRLVVYQQNLQYQAAAHAVSLQRRREEAQLEEDLVQARHKADLARRRECLELEAEYRNGNAERGVIGREERGRGSRRGRERG